MTARHWIEVAVLASALGLTGTAVAQTSATGTSSDDRSSASSYGMDAPSSGAIVTPEDRALGMGQDNARAGDRSEYRNDDRSTSNDSALSVNPGPSSDEELSVNPGPSNDEGLSVNPARPDVDRAAPRDETPEWRGSTTGRDNARPTYRDELSPPRTGSEVEPGDMGPADTRGE